MTDMEGLHPPLPLGLPSRQLVPEHAFGGGGKLVDSLSRFGVCLQHAKPFRFEADT